ncbi:MAG TPA: glycoside hydrolase family 28 protein [Verrucomicrobiae bacterium]
MKTLSALWLGCALTASAATYNVRDFGAVGDGHTLDTEAIQKALDACQPAGGTVLLPAGNYLSQPLQIRSATTLELAAGATLWASTNETDYLKPATEGAAGKTKKEYRSFLSGKNLTQVTLTGQGVIDGNGFIWWPAAETARQLKPGYTLPRPNLISLDHVTHLRVENLTLQNSPKFHLVPMDCQDVVISNVTFLAPERAANTDAMDPSGRDYLITHCRVDVGDDNIAIKAGKKGPPGTFQSENFLITDCTFLHGHGLSIGSETAGGVRNIKVRHCTFTNTENGIRIKSDKRRGGLVEQVDCEDITMENVNPALTLTMVYQGTSAGDAKSPGATAAPEATENLPYYRDIRISHLTATCPKGAGLILGLPESCISNVVLENVQITAAKGLSITNARGITCRQVSITAKDGKPYKTSNAEIDGITPP